ncbi:hypothetical protein BH24ACT3_BH24ACT3_15540 [soil metagenome]
MLGLLVLIFLIVPIAELYVIVQVAGGIGVGKTILVLIAVSALGAWLVKREGVGVARRIQAQLARGDMPTKEVVDCFLILLAGALMLTPGFLTDVLGLLLLFPPTRALFRTAVIGRFGHRVAVGTVGSFGAGRMGRRRGGPVHDVRATETTEAGGTPTGRPSPRPELGD